MTTHNDYIEHSESAEQGVGHHQSRLDSHTHRLGPLLLLGLSIAFVIAGAQQDFGSLSRPGPGLWPISIGSITGTLALISALLPWKGEEHFRLHEVMRAGALLVAFLLFPTIFEYVGFAVPALLLITFMMKFLSRESWTKSAIVAVTTTGVAYVLFGEMLSVRLPAFTLPF